ncbi:carboxylesterase/lipase family protein [Pseudonocardia acidicola]|uniref:Carboxylic ester hydrolase n=1 Tax=Pseudonocardia acidicola TaxID=2724939 RepID=A0ABX1SJC0_9PSEU|nr:carboxylesterase family protein [Pseudonocardia acidicola]NMI00603.1 carboxylesterase/lipase family protein [Pseudonocardia acidicola]
MTDPRTDPIVTTGAGRVRGRFVDGVARFRSVPYAAAPVGALRFAAPAPARPWDGVREAGEPGPNAPQVSRGIAGIDLAPVIGTGWQRGDEYLTVDVWTPDPTAAGLPVMVFVHGGAFVAGSGSAAAYDGTAFARSGVVLVTVNYRLGAEGFLPVPGGATNVGLRDQIAALEWVQRNAASFGGDAGNVTVFGESAGAMSIADLLASPPARGLFRRAVLQSGHAEMVRTPGPAARLVEQVAELLGVRPDVADFRARSIDDLLAVQATVSDPQRRVDLREDDGSDPGYGLGAFLPIVGDDVLPEHPLTALRGGASGAIDLLIGTNSEEMNLYLVPSGVVDVLTAEQAGAAVRAVRADADDLLQRYGLGTDGGRPGTVFSAAMTDLVFRAPAQRVAQAHAGRTHVYEFAWRSPAFDGRLGACHAVELPFVFDTLAAAGGRNGLVGAAPPQEVATLMHRAWVGFATGGDPGWPEHTADRPEVLRIDTGPTVVRAGSASGAQA